MRVLVACEFSGIVRDAFIAQGHDAISCDLLPSERPGPHIQDDVTKWLDDRWDLVIAHPPCTYLANSGVRWLHERPERYQEMIEAAAFFRACLQANGSHVAVENPVMHKYGLEEVGCGPDFTIQPWQFGHEETKRTCFWTFRLPPLKPTQEAVGRRAVVHEAPPSDHRWADRSRTYEGVAMAMAAQWGNIAYA